MRCELLEECDWHVPGRPLVSDWPSGRTPVFIVDVRSSIKLNEWAGRYPAGAELPTSDKMGARLRRFGPANRRIDPWESVATLTNRKFSLYKCFNLMFDISISDIIVLTKTLLIF